MKNETAQDVLYRLDSGPISLKEDSGTLLDTKFFIHMTPQDIQTQYLTRSRNA